MFANHSNDVRQLQNKIEQIEGEFADLQIEEQIDSLFANHLEEIQQRLEERISRWRSQYSTELQQLQDRIEHTANEFTGLQIELQNISGNLQQIENDRTSWRSQYSNKSQQLQNQIEHIESEFTGLQIELHNALNKLQQIENDRTSWRSQYSNESQQLQNQIEHIESEFTGLQSEWKNNQDVIELIHEDIKLLFDAFDELDIVFINIKTKVDILEIEVNNCEDNIAYFYNSYREPQTIYEAEGSTKSEFNTVLDVLLKAEQEDSILKIFDSARDSAREASYRNYRQIYSAFKAMAKIGEEYFKHQKQSTSMGNRLEEKFKERGFSKYRPTEHKKTRNQYGYERKFYHRGQYVPMFRHLTFNNNGCLQIYFEFDREEEKVIIGYCGKHLSTASRPK